MNKIQSRDYTEKENKRLKPTELGRVIAQLLEDNFSQIMTIGFTAHMEDDLEHIAENRHDWKQLLRDFWKTFEPTLEQAKEGAYVPKIETDLDCPKCGAKNASGGNWTLNVYNPYPGVMDNAPASNGYKPGFGVDLMLKDLGLAMDSSLKKGVATPLGSMARNLYSVHSQSGHGGDDFSSILNLLKGYTDGSAGG